MFLLTIVISLILSFTSAGDDQYANADQEKVSLSGSWDFYWEELITLPSESKEKPIAVDVPNDWYNYEGEHISKFGYATYVKTLNVDNDGSLGLQLDHVFSSYALYINGELIYRSGIVAESKSDYTPYREPVVVAIPERLGDELVIAIQAANYDHLDSGLYYDLFIGDYNSLSLELRIKQGISLFLAGGFFITGFILFGFSLSSRQLELQVFFYALFSLSMMYRMLGASPYPLHSLLPQTNFYLSITLEYLAIHTAALFGGLFIFETFKKQAIPALVFLFYLGSSISMGIVLFTGPAVFTNTLDYYLFFVLFYVLVFTYTIIKAKMQKVPSSSFLVIALVMVFIWTLFQAITFLNIGQIPFFINVVLVTAIIVLCNIALFQTFLKRVSQANQREAAFELASTKNTMLSLISHEIKIPVASLQMNLAMLGEAKDNPPLLNKIKDKSISSANQSINLIKQMLNDFLFFMSTEEETRKQWLKVENFHKRLKEDLSEEVIVGEVEDAHFQSHEVTLLYIVRTLVNNAYKHTRAEIKKPEIHIFNEGNGLVIEVRDFGDGITAEAIEKLGKVKRRLSNKHDVEGMGFYMAKELSVRLGHDLSIAQNEWAGTSAKIYIKQ